MCIRLVDPPVPKDYPLTEMPPGIVHAARALGLTPETRMFRRVTTDGLPLYEEV